MVTYIELLKKNPEAPWVWRAAPATRTSTESRRSGSLRRLGGFGGLSK